MLKNLTRIEVHFSVLQHLAAWYLMDYNSLDPEEAEAALVELNAKDLFRKFRQLTDREEQIIPLGLGYEYKTDSTNTHICALCGAELRNKPLEYMSHLVDEHEDFLDMYPEYYDAMDYLVLPIVTLKSAVIRGDSLPQKSRTALPTLPKKRRKSNRRDWEDEWDIYGHWHGTHVEIPRTPMCPLSTDSK